MDLFTLALANFMIIECRPTWCLLWNELSHLSFKFLNSHIIIDIPKFGCLFRFNFHCNIDRHLITQVLAHPLSLTVYWGSVCGQWLKFNLIKVFIPYIILQFQESYPHIYSRHFPGCTIQDKAVKKQPRGLLNLATLSRLKSMRVWKTICQNYFIQFIKLV